MCRRDWNSSFYLNGKTDVLQAWFEKTLELRLYEACKSIFVRQEQPEVKCQGVVERSF